MAKQDWRPYLERLRADPSDAEALAAIERILSRKQPSKTKQRAQRAGIIARFFTRVFMGPQLTRAVQDAWDAWSAHFDGRYEPTGERPWPELETRDVTAAVANRFIRVGFIGIMLGLIPAVMLLAQTPLPSVHVWHVQVQNRIITEQNRLTRDQFGVSYKTQLVSVLYDAACTRDTPGRCQPARVRQEAARALVELYRLQADTDPVTGEPRERQPADLSGAYLRGADLSGADFRQVRLRSGDLGGATMRDIKLGDAVLIEADLSEAALTGAEAPGADFSSSNLKQAVVEGANFRGATFVGTSFEDASLTSIDLTGAVFYPADGPQRNDYGKQARLNARVMRELTFEQANLIRAIFQGRSIARSSFVGAKLLQANFAKASLQKVSFKDADLSGANFTGAELIDVDLTGAKLDNAILRDVRYTNVVCPDGSKASVGGCS